MSPLSSGSSTPLWVYFLIAVPLTALSLAVVGQWAQLGFACKYLLERGQRGRQKANKIVVKTLMAQAEKPLQPIPDAKRVRRFRKRRDGGKVEDEERA